MKVTRKEFKDRVTQAWGWRWQDSVYGSDGKETIYILDTYAETQGYTATKAKLASIIWFDGQVIVDNTGLFFSAGSGTLTIMNSSLNNSPLTQSVPGWFFPSSSIPNHRPTYYSLRPDMLPDAMDELKEISKCVCGAHSTGSNRHSTWCDVKE